MNEEQGQDRLAQFRQDQSQVDAPPKRRRGILRAATNVWTRSEARYGRLQTRLVALAIPIIGITALAITLLVTSSGNGRANTTELAALQRTAQLRATTAPPTPTVAIVAAQTDIATAPADRANCDSIRGTSYLSDVERSFYLDTCVEPTAVVRAQPQRPVTSAPPASQPTPAVPTAVPPVATAASAASAAIALAVDWIVRSGPQYSTDASSCSAVQTSGHWVVTCSARLSGCQGSPCSASISVCVFDNPVAVRPSTAC
jgi:hypothetical protein